MNETAPMIFFLAANARTERSDSDSMSRIRAAALQIFSILIICISFATFAHGIALTSLGTRLKNYVLNLRLHWECFVISAIPYIRVIRGQKNRAFFFGLLFANPFIPKNPRYPWLEKV